MVLYVYAATLFVSAFILFLIQPMISKMILPKLGGTPQVWNTCMVFFQMVLLAGYAYTHLISSRLKLRQQIILHTCMLLLPLAVLFLLPTNFFNLYMPVVPEHPGDSPGWAPSNLGGNPILQTLLVLATVIGLPFLVVSTTAPLLQKWFAYTGHPAAKDPYFLYGASNLGSMLGLIGYIVAIEPVLHLDEQTWFWAIGYFVLVASVFGCVAFVWGPASHAVLAGHGHGESHPAPAAAPENPPVTAGEAATAVVAGAPQVKPGLRPPKKGQRGPAPAAAAEPARVQRGVDEIDVWRRLKWVALAAVPVSLMLGITTHITTDLTPMPLFWVLPLSLYLLTFVFVFARWPINWIDVAHPYVVYIQPVAICSLLMIDMIPTSTAGVGPSVFFNMIGFFITTLLCHGELAKDRPSTRHLTEFYLWMSVGGMLGGMFNALIAPLVFTGLAELGIAIFAAGFLRPKLKESGWTDDIIAGMLEPAPEPAHHGARGGKGGGRPQPSVAKPGATPQMALALDFILPLAIALLTVLLAFYLTCPDPNNPGVLIPKGAEGTTLPLVLSFGIPLAIACFYLARPLRFGLALGAVIGVHYFYEASRDSSLYSDRSFFGIISVKQNGMTINGKVRRYNQLLHGTTDHGMSFLPPTESSELGNPEQDFTRLATTYYHRYGPAGRVMEGYNWFKDFPLNTYHADARMPAAIVGQVMADVTSSMPMSSLANLWSEPPYCTIGLGTGTMASYGRPYQHVHYYEIDNHIRKLSLGTKRGNETYVYYGYEDVEAIGNPYFSYLKSAISRGCEVQVLMGDARLRMALPYKNFHTSKKDDVPGGGPMDFYHMMVVDAFSSDAIPAHLITKEAIKMYFDRLTEEGILCVHTSNRYVSLPKVVAAVALELNNELTRRGNELRKKHPDMDDKQLAEMYKHERVFGYEYACWRGHDQAPRGHQGPLDGREIGHYTSEWVMVARKPEYLKRLDKSPNYEADLREAANKAPRRYDASEPYWRTMTGQSRFLWTDNYYTLWTVLRILQPAGVRDD